MQCPACKKQMVEQDFGGALVDVCKNGCQGMWFDWLELAKLDESSEGLRAALDEALDSSRASDENRGKIACPRCGIPMYVHKYKKAREVSVDECANCGGFFLDSGELRAIRDSHMSDEEHQAYTNSLLADVPAYGDSKLKVEKQKARINAVNNLSRFLWYGHRRRRSWF